MKTVIVDITYRLKVEILSDEVTPDVIINRMETDFNFPSGEARLTSSEIMDQEVWE